MTPVSPEITIYLLVALFMAGAAFVQSVSGFGMAIVAIATLPLVIDLKDAIALIAVFNLFVSTLTLFWNRSGFSWKEARPLVIGMIIGIPLGYYF
ncbi:MAG: TSUP family transporter [Verrucomicrobiales bacterium]|nr:TSUP family transporter [Verrucomicrobiales bacterium]